MSAGDELDLAREHVARASEPEPSEFVAVHHDGDENSIAAAYTLSEPERPVQPAELAAWALQAEDDAVEAAASESAEAAYGSEAAEAADFSEFDESDAYEPDGEDELDELDEGLLQAFAAPALEAALERAGGDQELAAELVEAAAESFARRPRAGLLGRGDRGGPRRGGHR